MPYGFEECRAAKEMRYEGVIQGTLRSAGHSIDVRGTACAWGADGSHSSKQRRKDAGVDERPSQHLLGQRMHNE